MMVDVSLSTLRVARAQFTRFCLGSINEPSRTSDNLSLPLERCFLTLQHVELSYRRKTHRQVQADDVCRRFLPPLVSWVT